MEFDWFIAPTFLVGSFSYKKNCTINSRYTHTYRDEYLLHLEQKYVHLFELLTTDCWNQVQFSCFRLQFVINELVKYWN